ncbi:hypothetical protein F3Y22_tig00110418pilonHSYRG00378 [Hibiscus syriacus]|uniref:Uncharacterized protein n=1 Tax=Hibiscus syriacus TaxID=106335 RepID=A0A6A3AMI6_HIBSY|nr:hypothetical protein F3Y22_tig00110418pilonHSYRG00378 [Hibiscus syriacus]
MFSASGDGPGSKGSGGFYSHDRAMLGPVYRAKFGVALVERWQWCWQQKRRRVALGLGNPRTSFAGTIWAVGSKPNPTALFHVHCCAHILNIMVQHGLKKVKTIIKNVYDTVEYINGSEHRLKKFAELVGQFNMNHRRMVLEC